MQPGCCDPVDVGSKTERSMRKDAHFLVYIAEKGMLQMTGFVMKTYDFVFASDVRSIHLIHTGGRNAAGSWKKVLVR